jgi:hypothetical protein
VVTQLCCAADVDVVLCSEAVDDGFSFVSRSLRDSASAVQQTLLNGLVDAMLGVLDTLPTKEASTPPTAAQVPAACAPPHCPAEQPDNPGLWQMLACSSVTCIQCNYDAVLELSLLLFVLARPQYLAGSHP